MNFEIMNPEDFLTGRDELEALGQINAVGKIPLREFLSLFKKEEGWSSLKKFLLLHFTVEVIDGDIFIAKREIDK